MNYHQVTILFTQATLVAFIILLLFRLRKKLGIGLLLACLGLIQFLQVFISSSVYVSITNDFTVSPGSTVLFTVTIFALLIIYIKEDASETKKVIYTLLIVNVLVTIFLQLFGWNLDEISNNQPFSVLANLFDSRVWFLFVGTITLFIDTLLIIIIFEFISRYVKFLFIQICLTMLVVVSFDTLFFSVLAFWNAENLNEIIFSGLISKSVSAIFFSIIFYIYLRFFEAKDKTLNIFKIKDVFQPLSYKQKFETATQDIEKIEEMYRLLANNTSDLICLQEPDSTFKYISPSVKNLLGYEPSEFIGKQAFEIVHKDDVQKIKSAIENKTFNNKSSNALTSRFLHKEGHYVWLEFLASPIYKEKVLSYFVTSARDITQAVLAKEEIEKYQASLQKLTTEITLVEEKQKKEIAANIHDHLSQFLVISKMRIKELKKNTALKMIDEDLQFIESNISEALENSRKITYEISPPAIYQLGIIDALHWLLEDLETRHKIKFQINSNVTHIKLTDVKSILLYRSIQEVMKNAIIHAKPTLVTLDITKDKLGVHFLIVDNGVGFDTAVLHNPQNHLSSGFGLFTVQERIRNIQGKFTIKSVISSGTTINFFIPLTK